MGFNTGRKSSWSARANLAAVRKDMLTSPESTFATYGRETFIRFASAVCERPRDFIRRISFLRNAEPILSIAFTPYSVTYLLRGVKGFWSLSGEWGSSRIIAVNVQHLVAVGQAFHCEHGIRRKAVLHGLGDLARGPDFVVVVHDKVGGAVQ